MYNEYKEIYEIPNFEKEDRLNFFSLDEPELLLLEKFRANKAKILLILQLGYFKYSYLRRKVGFKNGGKIMVRLESEQNAYHECNRLICNMIVYYNSYILSQFLLQKGKKINHITILLLFCNFKPQTPLKTCFHKLN